MADNPYVNKVEYAGQTLIDVTDTTATEDDVAEGKAFTLASGAKGTGSLKLGNTHIWVGTCGTAATTRDKAVTITGVTEYVTGDIFVITFTNAQDYNGGPRLNVNSLGVKSIRRVTGSNATRYQWQAGETLILVYNGTYMLAVNNGLAGTTYYGLTKLFTSCISTSSTLALTPSSLNAYSERMIAGVPVYSAEETYAVGDRVRYSWYIYECNTAIAEAEAWNEEHWTQLPALQMQIDTLKTEVDDTLKLKFKDITDTTPMNVKARSGDAVTINNFVGCCARTAGVLPMPYYNNSIPYIKLCNYSDLSPFSGSATVRIWYV